MKLNSAKKRTAALTALALGAVIFAGAAFASYSAANGYEVGKTALKNLLKNENYTMNASFSVTLDENEIYRCEQSEKYDRGGDVILSGELREYHGGVFDYGQSEYVQDGGKTRACVYSYGKTDRVETTVDYNAPYYRTSRGCLDVLNGIDDENDLNTVQKIMNFTELAADTFVGDLKNNVVYVSGDDGSATYELSLDSVQIPELFNAGISVLFSLNGSSVSDADNDDPIAALGSEASLKSVYLIFTVDDQGRLTNGEGKVTAVGNSREAAVNFSLSVSDYGATVLEAADISSLPNITVINRYEDAEIIDTETAMADADGNVTDATGSYISDDGSVYIYY